MSLAIRSDVAALAAHRYLSLAQSDVATSIERLSSGLRINRAADDAAGLSIATGLRAQIGGMQVGIRNTWDAISVSQVAEGALSQTHAVLHRMRDLVVQGASSGSLGPAANQAIGTELRGLQDTLDHIARTTTFNGTPLLSGGYRGVFQVGANAGDTIELATGDASITGLGLSTLAPSSSLTQVVLTAGKADFGGHAGTASTFHIDLADDAAVVDLVSSLADPTTSFTVNGSAVDLTGVATRDALTAAVGTIGGVTSVRDATGVTLTASAHDTSPVLVTGAFGVSSPGTVDVPDSGGNRAKLAGKIELDNPGGSLAFAAGVAFDLASVAGDLAAATSPARKATVLQAALEAAFTGASVTVADDGAMTIVAGANADEAFTAQPSGAAVALTAIDTAIGAVSTTRGYLGAMQNRFEHVIAIQSSALVNLTAAESRIRDADVAADATRLARANILSNVAMAMLAQAATAPRTALALLQP